MAAAATRPMACGAIWCLRSVSNLKLQRLRRCHPHPRACQRCRMPWQVSISRNMISNRARKVPWLREDSQRVGASEWELLELSVSLAATPSRGAGAAT